MKGDYWDRNASFYDEFANIEGKRLGIEQDMPSLNRIGSGVMLMSQNMNPADAVLKHVRMGTGHIEFLAAGTGKGGGMGGSFATFEEIEKDQRQAIREIQKATGTTITTHATFQAEVLGRDREGNFSEDQREESLRELKKAIDFAADATFGGSVVVHTGEFQRPLYNMPGHEGLFRSSEDEQEKSNYAIVDSQKNKIVMQVSGDREYYEPIKKNNEDDYERNEDGSLKVRKLTFNEFVKEKIKDKDFQKELKKHIAQFNQNIDLSDEKIKDKEYLKKVSNNAFIKEYAAKKYTENLIDDQVTQSNFNALVSISNNKSRLREIKKFLDPNQNTLAEYGASSKEELWKSQGINSEEDLKKRISQAQEDLIESEKSAISQKLEYKDMKNRLKTMREYALDRAADSYAKLGMYAMQKTEKLKKDFEGSKFKDKVEDIYITMENVFPRDSGYGANADELIDLVKRSRNRMAQDLEAKYGKKEAEQIAEKHIKATFDTGHFHMWKKYFVKKDDESESSYENRYKNWYTQQVKKLADSGVLGNVHIADNFGYDDVHISPGEGTAPIKESLKILEQSGYNKKYFSEGSFNQAGKEGFIETWKFLGSNIYGGSKSWTNVGQSFSSVRDGYFGRQHRPYFVFGDHAPKSDDWKPWSGTTME
ncbi:MAG: hypothetical protein ACMXYC_02270 [Candidatus Woesearchaeota archaeon]